MFRILYVDDEPDLREIALLALSLDPGLEVRSASSGAEGIATVADWMPDLVLLDVMMPGMDGPATLARLREDPRTAQLPVVFITARAQPTEMQSFATQGARGVIAKPFDPMSLAQQVRGFLA
ncbi:response regulator [Erythrobacter sp. NE805]|uniref:response regulator n=1 Tax=Erythrobacter sp. NE805 TaxID=3389875 RepID=UPI00396B23A3